MVEAPLTPQIPPSTDPLNEVLHLMSMTGMFCSVSNMTAPWGVAIPAMDHCLMFHVGIVGKLWVEIDGAEPLLLKEGELALIPHGEGHRLVSEPGGDAPDLFSLPRKILSDRYELMELGGGGESCRLVCGAATFSHPAAEELIAMMPQRIHINPETQNHAAWLGRTVEFMIEEAAAPRPGGEVILTRLADILVIQAIRSWLESTPDQHLGWLGALRDSQIGRSIKALQEEPARQWTVESLARTAHMSRSSFSARFKELVGQSPMNFLTRWRMLLAKNLIAAENFTLAQAALELGYESEATFSRAFKRTMGYAPGALRR